MVGKILLTAHLFASLVWVGAVFMGTFIDWPASRESMKEGKFPFRFIIGQARRVFYSVYFGIIVLWVTGIGLLMLHPPQTSQEMGMMGFKIFALVMMMGLTLYGTFFTWPKMQLATDKEAFELYKYYMYRAMTIFAFGVLASITGLWVY